jgi:D-tyrosyl-tRNA(Tyr) deacylase
VTVDHEVVGAIEGGLFVLLGVGAGDDAAVSRTLAQKITGLRIFPDNEGKMNRSLSETGGQMLVVSQFTLYGDCRRGRRPSFTAAAPPELAERLYEEFARRVEELNITVARGRFRAHMEVDLVNDGPVTLWLDSRELADAPTASPRRD